MRALCEVVGYTVLFMAVAFIFGLAYDCGLSQCYTAGVGVVTW
jgi:hypothetical protein